MVQGMQPEFPTLKTIIGIGDNLPEGVVPFKDLLASEVDEKVLRDYLAGIELSANDVLTICWTSGTEADPKGVPRSHNHWISIAAFLVEGCDLDEGCSMLNPFPFINMASIGGMFVPWLLTGGKFVLHHPMDLKVFLEQVVGEKINYTVIPPTALNMLAQNPAILGGLDIGSLKTIGSGSAPLSPWMVRLYQEKYGIAVVNIFGSNEGISFISGARDFPSPDHRALFFPRWGVPGFNWKVSVANRMSSKLVDPQTRKEVTETGVPGEMLIKGPAVFAGYYQRPDLTEKSFDDEGYFCTGDLFSIAGEEDNLNSYLFCGRSKDIIIRGGVNISPEEIENLIIEHPDIAEVAVVGYPDPRMGERVCAVIAPVKDKSITLEEVVAYLKQRDITVYKLPEKIHLTTALPRNPVGKVVKAQLRDMVRQEGIML
jgi:acyl-CoA synthetase (AMP-forming)/AMP-acid ligase II